jgi:transcriptional regulator with XRE-family HTH domain
MGKGKRQRPARLGEKLARIRGEFGLSQNEMLRRLGLDDELTREELSAFERGVREPSLFVLLEFARAANVFVDVLIDDSLELPERLPSLKKSEGVLIASQRKRKR